jgi:hypothetical protein
MVRESNGRRGILVEADDADFLESRIDTQRELVDIGAFDGSTLHAAIAKDYAAFRTIPLDVAGRRLRLYNGRVTIWSGFPGHGKTTLLRQVVCKFLRDGERVLVANFEEDPGETVYEMAKTAWAEEQVTAVMVDACTDYWSSTLRVWGGRLESQENARLLAAIRVLARRDGIRHAFIDSLMCLDVANGDFESQRLFAKNLVATARSSGVHIHLVAHPRKPVTRDLPPDLNEVAGSADLGRLVDNVLFVRRADADASGPQDVSEAEVVIAKQRRGGFCGAMGATFYRSTRQFEPKGDGGVSGPWLYLPEEYIERCLPIGTRERYNPKHEHDPWLTTVSSGVRQASDSRSPASGVCAPDMEPAQCRDTGSSSREAVDTGDDLVPCF